MLYEKHVHKRVRPETKDKKNLSVIRHCMVLSVIISRGRCLIEKMSNKMSFKPWFCKNVGDQEAVILQFKDSKG